MKNDFYTLCRLSYKKAVAVDICSADTARGVPIILYHANESLRYYILHILSHFTNVDSMLEMKLSELLDSKFSRCVDSSVLSFLDPVAKYLEIIIEEGCDIDPEDIFTKDAIMAWLHNTMSAECKECFNPERDTLLCGAIYHNNTLVYDCISLRKD